MHPIVSIITPTYNLEQYIEETGRSILAQSIPDWEWIIVDDESNDNTLNIVEKWNDPRIKILRSHHVGNLSILRNMGAKAAKGKYLAFVDGDDILMPEKLDRQLNHLKTNGLKWAFTSANNYFEVTAKVEKRQIPFDLLPIVTSERALETMLQTNYICISSVMMSKEDFWEIGGFEEKFKFSEDKDLWLRAAAHGWDLGYCKEVLLQYRVRPTGLYQSKKLQYLYFNFTAYAKFKERFPQHADRYSPIISRYYAHNYKNIFALKFATDQPAAYRDLISAIALNPFEKGCWILLVKYIFFKEKFRKELKKQFL